jgi:hypothetical protein
MALRSVLGGRGTALTALVPVLVASVLLLTGCAGPSSPVRGSPSRTATPAPPTSSARPPAPATATATATDIFVSATSIELRDASGKTQSTFDYFQPASEVVAGLSQALGSAPILVNFEGYNDTPPTTRYKWDGFVLNDPLTGGMPPFSSNTWVRVSAEAVNGVRISTVDGIAVGDSAAELEARYPDTSFRHPLAGQPALHIGVGFVPLPPSDDSPGSDRTFSVELVAPDPLGPITQLTTPSPNWGA